MAPKTIIHIGLPKCASTFLQKNIFPLYAGVNHNSSNAIRTVVARYIDDSIKESEAKKTISSLIKNNEKYILSKESFCGTHSTMYVDYKQNLQKIETLFPTAKAIIIIRKQSDFLQSLYNQAIRKGITKSAKKFLCLEKLQPLTTTNIKTNLKNTQHVNFRCLNYNNLIKSYQKAYGKNNILVLPMELLQQEPSTFIEKINIFCEEKLPCPPSSLNKINTSTSQTGLYGQRFINNFKGFNKKQQIRRALYHIVSISINTITHLIDMICFIPNKPLSKNEIKIIDNYYADNNKKLSTLIDIDLQKYGY